MSSDISDVLRSYEPSPSEWLAKNWQGHAISELVRERPYNLTGTSIGTPTSHLAPITASPLTLSPYNLTGTSIGTRTCDGAPSTARLR